MGDLAIATPQKILVWKGFCALDADELRLKSYKIPPCSERSLQKQIVKELLIHKNITFGYIVNSLSFLMNAKSFI